jgi:hypothetical protein
MRHIIIKLFLAAISTKQQLTKYDAADAGVPALHISPAAGGGAAVELPAAAMLQRASSAVGNLARLRVVLPSVKYGTHCRVCFTGRAHNSMLEGQQTRDILRCTEAQHRSSLTRRKHYCFGGGFRHRNRMVWLALKQQ